MVRECRPCKPGLAATYQDQKYGKNMRVFTQAGKAKAEKGGEAKGKARKSACTVCGRQTG